MFPSYLCSIFRHQTRLSRTNLHHSMEGGSEHVLREARHGCFGHEWRMSNSTVRTRRVAQLLEALGGRMGLNLGQVSSTVSDYVLNLRTSSLLLFFSSSEYLLSIRVARAPAPSPHCAPRPPTKTPPKPAHHHDPHHTRPSPPPSTHPPRTTPRELYHPRRLRRTAPSRRHHQGPNS